MKNPVLYMGLFLMAFALYAGERSQKPAEKSTEKSSITPVDVPVPVPVESNLEKNRPRASSSASDRLFRDLSAESIFKNPPDGMRLIRDPWAVLIRFEGDDVFSDGEYAIRESWYPALDRIGGILREKGVLVEVIGYADEKSPLEKKAGEFGESDYSFSYSRAEWLARYFENKGSLQLHGAFVLKAMGGVPHGKKVEMSLTLP